ncbi:hypothetical protein HOF92_16710 [bacterium]|jgi:hypothetical protein|nr:hypothetical protein [bacterium]
MKLLKHIALVLAFSPALMSEEQIYLIAHKDLPISQISTTELMSLFLKKIDHVGGKKLNFVQYRTGSRARTGFARTYLNMTMDEESLYWRKLLVQRGARPPKSKKNKKIMLKFISKHPDTISYILDFMVLPSELKLLKVIP